MSPLDALAMRVGAFVRMLLLPSDGYILIIRRNTPVVGGSNLTLATNMHQDESHVILTLREMADKIESGYAVKTVGKAEPPE